MRLPLAQPVPVPDLWDQLGFLVTKILGGDSHSIFHRKKVNPKSLISHHATAAHQRFFFSAHNLPTVISHSRPFPQPKTFPFSGLPLTPKTRESQKSPDQAFPLRPLQPPLTGQKQTGSPTHLVHLPSPSTEPVLQGSLHPIFLSSSNPNRPQIAPHSLEPKPPGQDLPSAQKLPIVLRRSPPTNPTIVATDLLQRQSASSPGLHWSLQ